jgi:Cytochrome c7 and related cytochrome c
MKRLCALALVLGSASCATFWWSQALPSGGDRIKAPHDAHKKAQVECLACHEEIYDATDFSKRYLPSEAKCLECHAEKKQQGRCEFCHTDARRAAPWPTVEPRLQLSHATHIERTKEDCAVCHKTLPNPLRTVENAPKMAACTSCHEHKQEYQNGKCGGCHLDLRRYPLEPVSMFSHQGDYLHEHARAARSTPETCATCHEQTFCADCHAQTVAMRVELKLPERVGADFIHRNDYVGRHAVEARADAALCRRCHGTSFCESCHQAQNLTPGAASPRDPHPPGWSFPGSAAFHGDEARRDIASCAACHDQGAQSICVSCHKVGGIGGNPHPPGWPHGRDEIARNNMCLVCH